jgi:hypothetical protein
MELRPSRGFTSPLPVPRRTFLASSTLAVSSLVLPRVNLFAAAPMIVVPRADQWGFFWNLLKRFGRDVFYDVVAPGIGNWFTRLGQEQRQAVSAGNTDLVQRGFFDPAATQRPIYGDGGTSPRCVYYPAELNDGKQRNGAAPFYDFCTCTCRAVLAVPTMTGLTAAAQDLRGGGWSTRDVSQALVPDHQTARSFGTFEDPYQTPDTYTSEDNTRVTVNYDTDGGDRGEVRVLAVRDNGTGEVVLNRTYTLSV